MNSSLPIILLATTLLAGGCKESGAEDTGRLQGVVINEIAAHDQTADAPTWVEILNTGAESIDISGLGLFLSDQ